MQQRLLQAGGAPAAGQAANRTGGRTRGGYGGGQGGYGGQGGFRAAKADMPDMAEQPARHRKNGNREWRRFDANH